MLDFILFFGGAWVDPEAALTVAEAEPDKRTRQELINQVAHVWAIKLPDRIARALKTFANGYFKDRILEAAAGELEWRKHGYPPRTTSGDAWTPIAIGDPHTPRAMVNRVGAHPDAIRVLENPNETAWLTGSDRDTRLNEAAEIAYFETDERDRFWRIIALLPALDQSEVSLHQEAENASLIYSPVKAIAILTRIKSSRQYVNTVCRVIRGLIGRSQKDVW